MQDWVKAEMENQVMGYARLNKTLPNMSDTLNIEPSKSIPCANDIWAETFADYRYLDNEKVGLDSILAGHKAATLDRMQREPVALIPQDTTFLKFANDSKSNLITTLAELYLYTVKCGLARVVTR